MSYAAQLKEEVRMRADVPTVRPAAGEDRESAVSALRALGAQATQLATQLERGQLSEATLDGVWEHINGATRAMVEATRAAFDAQRRK